MEKQQDGFLELRKYFLFAGLLVAVLISAWYLYELHLQEGAGIKTDPIWTQFVNVMLIFFAAVFQFSLFHKGFVLVVKLVRRKKQG
jgi:hypothetical protein